MKRLRVFTVVLGMVAALLVGLTPTASSSAPRADEALDAYTATVSPSQLRELARLGHDVGANKASGSNVEVDLVLTKKERDQLHAKGIFPHLTKVKGGQTVRQFAAAEAANGFTVWKSWDEPGGIRDQLVQTAAKNPSIAKLVKIGTTLQGRDMYAIKLTQGARGIEDGKRPAVLFSATQHAREWIATEVDRRLMNWYIERWRADDPEVKKLLQTTELWFVPVANPDGYQYTFDTERLWRKNLRDVNGDGQITTGDGVDLNRNFPNHWGYDEEGSSSISSSETYRGTAPVSEPETAAMKGLLDRIGFAFQVNYHSNGQWLLYAEGWQIGTPTFDDPIYYAMSGNLDKPAIKDFHPGLSSDVLYVTNGETTDYAHVATGALAWTPELSEGCDGCGFVFPDDEALVQAEFERNLPFAQSVVKSAGDPDDPVSTVGLKTKPFYLNSDDPYKRGNPHTELTFQYSYGDPQPVAVNAKRSLGPVTVKWRVNGGAVQSAPTSEWAGGERYSPASVYYHQMRGVVTGTDPGDSVEVWFEGGGQRSDSFTYQAVSESGNRVVVVAAEDYTGASPAQTPGPHYLDYYLNALADNGIEADVYNVDARGRVAPDALGVLSHYDAAIWYSGDDVVTRRAGQGAGNADRLALDELLEFRAYLNEGGAVAYTSDFAGAQYTGNVGTQLYDPKGEIACNPMPSGVDPRRCLRLAGSGDGTNDVLQYWFGGFVGIAGDGLDEDGNPFGLVGTDTPFEGLTWGWAGRTAPTTRTTPCPTSRRAASCPSTSSSSSTAGRRRCGTSRVGRSHRGPARSTSTRRSPTCPTSASREPSTSHPTAPRCRSGRPTTPRPTGTTSSSRPTPRASRTGRRCPTSTATRRPRRVTAVNPAGWTCTRSWRITRPGTAPARAPRPAHPARGMPPAATPAAGSSGPSTSPPGRAVRSRSRSRTRATGPPRGSASSSTTSKCPRARAPPRSRADSTAGACPQLRTVAPRTPTPGFAPTPPASRSAARSRPRRRFSWASGSRA